MQELTVQTRRSHLNPISRTMVALVRLVPKGKQRSEEANFNF